MTLIERVSWTATRLALLVLLASTGAAGLAAPGAQAGTAGTGRTAQQTWSVQLTPTIPDPSGDLSSVSCTSPTFCVAVGQPLFSSPLAAAWNGTSWRRLPVSGEGPRISPQGVSCASPTFCVAVGFGQAGTEIATWNGTAWAATKSPPYNGHLMGVSCSSPAACLAVGETIASSGNTFPMAERWNGTRWLRVTVPQRRSFHLGSLNAVSCTSATACTAVGSYGKPGKDDPLIERWNGASLAPQQAAQAPSAESTLTGVSCPEASGCVAVGQADNSPSAQSWNGTGWSAMTLPAANGTLDGVSCAAITACTATGSINVGTRRPVLAEQLAGSTWSVQQIPTPAGAGGGLSSVSCVKTADCVAVGSYTSQSQAFKSLGETWNGTRWTIQPTPNGRRSRPEGSFDAVSCADPAQCTAVGNFQTSTNAIISLGETWNGSRWALRGSPPPSSQPTEPAGISCPAATMCMTVGGYTGAQERTYPWAAIWNGTRWTTVKPPKPPGNAAVAELDSVSCASATSCIAVGGEGNSPQNPLAYAWNGTKWTAQPPPATGGFLNGVSCTSAASCIAVGDGATWLAETWNGQTWTPMPTSGSPGIDAVSCSSATACTAVGISDGAGQAAIERWDGTTWTAQQAALAPPGFSIAQLNGVSCASATACTAVGYYWNGQDNNTTHAFIQAWDGTSWTATQAPDTGFGELNSVVCTAPSACIAVGAQKVNSINEEPLAESSR